MLSEKQLKQLLAENELLLLQLEDVNEVIKQREAELDALRAVETSAREMQSKLDMNLHEFHQMQDKIGEKQQIESGNANRLEELENELFQSIKMEKNYYEMLDENISLQANLKDTNNELIEASKLYKKIRQLTAELTSANSNLELALLEIDSLKADLKEANELNSHLLQKKLQ